MSLNDNPTATVSSTSPRPEPTALQPSHSHETQDTSFTTLRADQAASAGPSRKKRKDHRGGKKKRNRRQSFAVPASEDGSGMPETSENQLDRDNQSAVRSSFYRIQGRNNSNTSLESEALLDHRYANHMD